MTIYTHHFIKDPYAVKDYTINWTNWLDGDTIASSAWSIPTGITKDSDIVLTGNLKTVIWFSGGTTARDYECFNTITTTGGRTERAKLVMQIR